MSLENVETVSLETSPASAQTQINCRWCGVSLLHVACASVAVGKTTQLEKLPPGLILYKINPGGSFSNQFYRLH